MKYLFLRCRIYQNVRQVAGITRETAPHTLLFTPKWTTMLQDFIQSTEVATRKRLLQGEIMRMIERRKGRNRVRNGTELSLHLFFTRFSLSFLLSFVLAFLSPFISTVSGPGGKVGTGRTDKNLETKGGPCYIVSREKEETKKRHRTRSPQPRI